MYQWVMSRLRADKGRWPEVALGSGVSRRTIEKIANRQIADPGVSHIEKLAKYYGRNMPAHDPGWEYVD
jgi:transcriptional regulator with XRE-family HTH domain